MFHHAYKSIPWSHNTHFSLKAQRDPDEEADYMVFEQLMAEAAAKKGKDDKKNKKSKKEDSNHPFDSHENLGKTAETSRA
jgi:hypothetical protein